MAYDSFDRIAENRRNISQDRGWARAMLRDIHFWIPLIVFLGGLFLLACVH